MLNVGTEEDWTFVSTATLSLFPHAPGLAAETALIALDLDGIALSSGAACSSGKVRPSQVLGAMGVPDALARCGLRVSLGWNNNENDIVATLAALERLLARAELVPRLHELAARHGLAVSRVTIRSQTSRWGSCSRGSSIALNFRLVQMPPDVCEYVLIHELMHLKQQNHSRRYWRLVEAVCPDYLAAEGWLRTEGKALF